MGQYYYIVNLDKEEYIQPYKFGDGMKLLEFGVQGGRTMTGLSILLADSNNRGSGDLLNDHPIIGSWSGDRIVVAGDYADLGKYIDDKTKNLYFYAEKNFKDISEDVKEVMYADEFLKKISKMNEGRIVRFANDFNVLLEEEIRKNAEIIKSADIAFNEKGEFISCFLSLIQNLINEVEAKYPIKEEEIYKYYNLLVEEGRFSKK